MATALCLARFLLGAAVTPPAGAAALELTAGGSGIAVEAGDLGVFTVDYPRLISGGKEESPSEVRVGEARAFLRYPGGTAATVLVEPGGFTIRFTATALGLERFSTTMLINFFHNTGAWSMDGEFTGFPQDKPSKPHLFQGNAPSFTFRSLDMKKLVFTPPPATFQQLTDNREWNWNIFAWTCFVPFDRARTDYPFKVVLDLSQEKRVILVDRWGQNARKVFPGKLSAESELEKDREAESGYLGSFPKLAVDPYGGTAGTRDRLSLGRTGFFHVERAGDRWLLVDPEGNAFFQLGVCSTGPGEDYTYVTGRERVFDWLPERTGRFSPAWHPDKWWGDKAVSFYVANVIRKYGSWDPEANVIRNIRRLRAFGFNSSGAWSFVSAGTRRLDWPYTPFLPLGRWDLDREMIPGAGGVLDPFDPGIRKAVEEAFARAIAPAAPDPLIIGYFLGNEQDFEKIPAAVPALAGSHPCKVRLVRMLKDKYRTIEAFNRAWGMREASFDRLADLGLPVRTPAAVKDMDAYLELFLDEYYGFVRATFRKHDSHHLLIGNRWRPDTAKNAILCRVAGRYLDVVSVNYYTRTIDPAFLARVHESCGRRPVLLSEFHFTCDAESGLTGSRDIPTQAARGQTYARYLEAATSLPYVVGLQWFTLIDQPVTGRYFEEYTGENYNIGLFSVVDRPYRPLIAEMAKANAAVCDLLGRLPGMPRAGLGADSLFPFVLPWDDATPGITNLSGWLPKPAGKFGHIQAAPDGHLYAGQERIRLHGVDLAFGANFPAKDDAGKIAARMARFGINIVRFHIMDMDRYPRGILARSGTDTRDLDPEALDRLDWFSAQLKRNGIYTYLCLLNYRPFNAADGLPKEIEELGGNFQDRHVIGFWDARILDLQKEYARKLLSRRNPYTRLTWAQDPAVAFVEINNENGLIHAWLGGTIDRLPDVFLRELTGQWNRWLAARYGSTGKLEGAWGASQEPLRAEMLANPGFIKGTDHWDVERHEAAEATATATDEAPGAIRGAVRGTKSARLDVTRLGTEGWHIRFEQTGLNVLAGRPYTLTFWAKTAPRPGGPVALHVSIEQAHAPWRNLGLAGEAELSAEWRRFQFVVLPDPGDDNARLVFDPPFQTGTYWLAGVSLRPGGVFGLHPDERLEDGTIAAFPRSRAGERTAQAQRDWIRFLWETEDRYWQTMYRLLKDDLKVKGLVIGTVVGCSTPNLMAKLDAVDTHAYWQHPVFPGRPWDSENWFVRNRSMVSEAGGVLPDLALRRVLGKPFCVTEYGHAAPAGFVGEGSLLRDAYAALQDWDYVSTSRYSHGADWNLRRIRNYFDIDQHPTKMLTMIPAAAIFLRSDVSPAREEVVAVLDRDQEIDALRHSGPWALVHAGTAGVPRETALIHRVAIAVQGQATPAAALGPDQAQPKAPRYVSDTSELAWDLTDAARGVVTVNAKASKAVVGYGAGKRFDLGGVIIEPGPTLQDGWSAITVTVMEGDLSSRRVRLLITATGRAENSRMGWKNAELSTVGTDWGEAPSLVEGIPARITLPLPAKSAHAWPLDERGQRRAPLTVEAAADGGAIVSISPRFETLWYEVEAK